MRFTQPDDWKHDRQRRQPGGDKRRDAIIFAAEREWGKRDDRADDKAQAKRRADQPQALRAGLLGGAVGDHGLCGRDIGARQAVDDARQE